MGQELYHRFEILDCGIMAYTNGGIIPYPPHQGNGYALQPMPTFNQRPNNVRKVGKHEDEEAGKLFVGGLRYVTKLRQG